MKSAVSIPCRRGDEVERALARDSGKLNSAPSFVGKLLLRLWRSLFISLVLSFPFLFLLIEKERL